MGCSLRAGAAVSRSAYQCLLVAGGATLPEEAEHYSRARTGKSCQGLISQAPKKEQAKMLM